MRSSTFDRFSIMCSKVLPTTITSSRYIRQISHCRPAIAVSINLWIVAGAQVNKNDILRNWNSPLRVTKAVFTETCQYPEQRSSVENHVMPERLSSDSSIRGNGYVSFKVRLYTSDSPHKSDWYHPFFELTQQLRPMDYMMVLLHHLATYHSHAYQFPPPYEKERAVKVPLWDANFQLLSHFQQLSLYQDQHYLAQMHESTAEVNLKL